KPVPAQPVRSSGPSGAHVSSNAPLQTTPNLHSPSPAVPTGEPEASTSVPLPETPATLLTPATGNSDLPTATLEPAPVSQAVPPALALHTETPAALVMNTMQAALTLRPVPFQARYLGWEPIFPAYSHVNRTQHTAGWKKTLGITGMERTIRPEWSLGLFYIPEIYHSEDLHAEKTLYGFDGMMRYTWFNYTLEFGLGLSRVRNENLYTVDYNAYLGTYKDLDSIAFSVDTVNQVIVPQYFFSEVKVYDSTTSQYFERTVNTYTYVQFPLMLGYRHPLGRFSLSLRGGPMLSVLVGSREPQIYVDQASDRILRVDDQTPGRIRTNWQFLMNAGLSYALTRKLSLSLEPGIRYYLNPIYQELQTKPWSVNLRTGIIYEF
ncbi:MAG TPA: hypothetical protein P5550_10095, partial [Bacteroidales bacterium]|nr:hypothetical protein [Bacteroidales bacterium]